MTKHPIAKAAAVLWLTVALPCGWALAVGNANQRAQSRSNRRLIDYTVGSRVDSCEKQNNGRLALQSVLDAAAHPPPTGSSSVDFSRIDGWTSLPATTQFFLTNLQLQLSKPGGSAYLSKIAADYRSTNPSTVDCARLGRELRSVLAASR